MASVFKHGADKLIQEQSFARRYKGSILIIASGVVAILSQLATSTDWEHTTVGAVLSAVAAIAAMLINRFTKDGITPSMATRLEGAAHALHMDRPNVTDPVPDSESSVPAYDMASTNEEEYVGEHRVVET